MMKLLKKFYTPFLYVGRIHLRKEEIKKKMGDGGLKGKMKENEEEEEELKIN